MTNSFFSPSITLDNGASILTGDNAMILTGTEGESFKFRVGGEFADVAPDFLNYETLIGILNDESWNEFDVSDLMQDSLENEKEHFGI